MKYRLLTQHVLPDGRLLDEGTEVGDETGIPWVNPVNGAPLEPTTQMEGLDDEARAKVKELHQKLYGTDPPWDVSYSEEVREARRAEAEAQEKLDKESEPVSATQEAERKVVAEAGPLGVPPGPARERSSTATASPTRGGATAPSPGPAKEETSRPKG